MSGPLRLALVVPCTEAEGPGRRFAIWAQGCPLRCPGCCNPELFDAAGGTEWSVDALAARILATPGIEGLTLLGGEPVAQAAGFAKLCRSVRQAGLTTVLFTGYTLAELSGMGPDVQALLARTDVVIDGRFDRARPETRRRWIGSANQTVTFLSDRYRASDPRFSRANTLEIRLTRGELRVNGWPAASVLGGARS